MDTSEQIKMAQELAAQLTEDSDSGETWDVASILDALATCGFVLLRSEGASAAYQASLQLPDSD